MRNDFLNTGIQLLRAIPFQIPSYFSKKCKTIAPRRGGRETQAGDLGLSVISCCKYRDRLDGQTMRGA